MGFDDGQRRPRNGALATMGSRLRVLFASAEMHPFAKVGGLADVSAALPKQLVAMGHEVRVIIPAYAGLGGEPVMTFDLPFGHMTEHLVVRRLTVHGGVEVLTLGAPGWFEHRTPYGYQDRDVLPFVLFSLAVSAYAAHAPWRPDVIHANDWHTGLVAQDAREGVHRDRLAGVGVVFTIHNIAYRGPVGATVDQVIGLPPAGSLLARGIRFADQVSTVSPTYLQEVLTPAYSGGMHDLLRARRDDAHGIRNGVDYTDFSPESDPWLTSRYNGSFVVGKRQNKAALQKTSALDFEPARPLLGMVARLVPQKGVGLLCRAVDDLVARGGQLVVVGTGDRRYSSALRSAARRHRGSVAFHETSDEGLARLLYAGSDLFLAPSMFEPCGLTPLIALRYGAIPVVRRTGGMADTILDYAEDPGRGVGFTFGPRRVTRLLSAVDAALSVYHDDPQWRSLQRRAMSADYSWRVPAQEYTALYRTAVARRRSGSALPLPGPTDQVRGALPGPAPGQAQFPRHHHSSATTRRLPMPIALVHHANQYLITEGYPDREGLTALIRGYTALLRLHERYRVPAHVHLSGTLIEAAAWANPEFLQFVRHLRERRLVTLVGGAYSESVLPQFDDAFIRRQVREIFGLYERHLGCPPQELSIFWVPERVWHTGALAPALTDPALPNGGFRYVLLDDRLLYPTDGQYVGSDRELFDASDPSAPPPADAARLYRIADGNGLHALPISTPLRYWVPPSGRNDWTSLDRLTAMTVAPGDDTVLVYADDIEKTAGVGPWDPVHLDEYDAFLGWLTSQPHLLPVSLPAWLAQRRRPAAVRDIEAGTFRELARGWGAEEDYSGWSADPAWAPYRGYLATSEAAVLDAERSGATGSLLDLAWTHLLACGYETGWRDTTRPDRPVAPWAKALASHARSSRVLADAARWFVGEAASLRGEVCDIDDDGEDEVVLANHHLYAVLAPGHGGRLVYLACRTDDGGALLVGNPSDDWNWQEELNKYMDTPANHPGALADEGAFHDRYSADVAVTRDGVTVDLVSLEGTGPLRGARKRLFLGHEPALSVRYEKVRDQGDPAAQLTVVRNCLSPDYATLLREGRSAIEPYDGLGWRGMRTGDVSVWLAADETDGTWIEPEQADAGHGVTISRTSSCPTFDLVIGAGPTDPQTCRKRLTQGRSALAGVREHSSRPRSTA